MKTIFSRVLLAQVVAVVLALIVAVTITRTSLKSGFETFLEQQETRVLQNVTPVLAEFYQRRGGWRALQNNPAAWNKVWRMGTFEAGDGAHRAAPPARRPLLEGRAPPKGNSGFDSPPDDELRWPGRAGRGNLRERLFLLDAGRQHIAGAELPGGLMDGILLEAVRLDGETVGWVGFSPRGTVLPPEAERFLGGQVRIMAWALAAALAVAAVLAWALARTVSRPVQSIGAAVRRLSDGEYSTRADDQSGGEIAELARNVNQLADSLERNRTARRRWMADIAHELRTPVAVMKGEIEAMADGVRKPGAETIASLVEEADHLAMMIEDLHTLALSDAGALDINKQVVDLVDLCVQAGELFQKRLADRGIALQTDLPGECLLPCDPVRVRQLIHNLLENCCRYTREGGKVRLALECGEPLALTIEDSGPGVEAIQRKRLFERFYRAEQSRARASGGSGLGLAICKNIAEAHGGSIEALPSPMGGLAIRVTLQT